MQPSNKSVVEYMMELNRMFLNSSDINVHTPRTFSFQSSQSQPTPSYSSSSTDSYSPETFPELSYKRSHLYQRSETCKPETPRSINEAPFALARRPIVGRKILGSSEQRPVEHKSPEDLNFEQRFGARMSPITHWSSHETPTSVSIEPKNEKNAFYELFPGENRGIEFRTPVKTPSVYSNLSSTPTISQSSPTSSNFGMFTPPRYTTPFNYRASSPTSFGATSPMNLGPSSPRNLGARPKFEDGVQKMCTFCRKNGETPLVYMTHTVKEKRGTKNIVTCPILRSHVCSTCGVSGDQAHTITYCPVLRSSNNGMPLKSTTITLKNTRIKSNGRRRY